MSTKTKPGCSFSECMDISHIKKLCKYHYFQQIKGRTPRLEKEIPEEKCSFENCTMPRKAKGLCGAHWLQANNGQELKQLKNQENLWERVNKNIIFEEECWIWTGRTVGKDRAYGSISFQNKVAYVHRILFEYKVRMLKPEETLDHLCRTTLCVNPYHMEPVSLSENIKRMHAFRNMFKEIDRMEKLLIQLGYNPKTGEKLDANISALS